MFRLCDDQSLVDLLLDPTRTPTNAQYEALEECFQRGNIRCDSVDGNDCGMVEDCYANDARDWEACQEGEYIVRPRVNFSTCRARRRRDPLFARSTAAASSARPTADTGASIPTKSALTVRSRVIVSKFPSRRSPRRTRSSTSVGTRSRTTRPSWAARTSRLLGTLSTTTRRRPRRPPPRPPSARKPTKTPGARASSSRAATASSSARSRGIRAIRTSTSIRRS